MATDGAGCVPQLGLLDSKLKRSFLTYFGVTKFDMPFGAIIYGDGFKVKKGTMPNCTIWVDRTCPVGNPTCGEKGKLLASFPVTVKNGWGSFNTNPYHALQFGKADLGPQSPHKLQAFVDGHVGEILFTVN
jgi:hypothetical protein